ncbi:methyltransferase domain-containing protein [Halobacteriaceae archaeon GCM10025711]
MLDYQRGGLRGDCVARDGDDTSPAAIRGNYFNAREAWPEDTFAVLERLPGPVVDVGCGAGQHALWFQDHGVDVVGVDVSPCAVAAARERGVDDVREMDMFDLSFPRDRFRSALVNGTQVGLAGSLAGVSEFLADLAFVTDEHGVAAVDNYHPPALDPDAFFGYRPDPAKASRGARATSSTTATATARSAARSTSCSSARTASPMPPSARRGAPTTSTGGRATTRPSWRSSRPASPHSNHSPVNLRPMTATPEGVSAGGPTGQADRV